jgi:hypothetical protein
MVGIGAPSKIFCAVQDFFDAHLEDHIGMRADPGSARRDITQHLVEYSPGLPFMDRIDPHEDSINRQKLLAHLVGEVVGINRRLGMNAKCRQLFKDAVKAIVLRSCGSPALAIAAPENCDSIVLFTGHIASLKLIATTIPTARITVPATVDPYATSAGLST